VANLLPQGVAAAVAANDCPKVYVPSTGVDNERVDETVADTVKILLDYLQAGAVGAASRDLLDYVLVDSKKGLYPGNVDQKQILKLGVEVVDADLAPYPVARDLDPEKLAGVLLSLI
jgi:hypothetical protein